MGSDLTLTLVFGIPLAALFISPAIERRLAERHDLLSYWNFAFRISWGFALWFLLTALSAIGLQKIFPDQSIYVFSGSGISAVPGAVWGGLIAWVCLGKDIAAEGDGKLATFDQRIDSLGVGFVSLAKYAGCTAIVIIGLIAAYIIGQLIDSRLEEMSPGKAIIGGAIIVGLAIFYGLRSR